MCTGCESMNGASFFGGVSGLVFRGSMELFRGDILGKTLLMWNDSDGVRKHDSEVSTMRRHYIDVLIEACLLFE